LYLSEQRFQAIYDSVNDGILIQDVDSGAMLDVNRRLCEWLGYSQQELLSMDLGGLGLGIWPYTRDVALEWAIKAIEGVPQTFEWLCSSQSGQLVWLEINMRRTPIGGVDRLLVTAGNITQRKRTEMEATARLKRAEAQNAVSLALAGVGPDFAAALKLIAQHLSASVGDLCVLDLMGEDDLLHTEVISQPYIGGEPFLPEIKNLAPTATGILSPGRLLGAGQVAGTGEALRLEQSSWKEIQGYLPEEFHAYLEHFRAHSILLVPMRTEGMAIGTITLVKGGSSRPYSVEDQATLQNLADRAALTITNARLYAKNLEQARALREANQQLEKRVEERTAELERANAKLQEMAMQDGLTGLANRRHFDVTLDMEVRRARRTGGTLALLLGDVDCFKRYNDRYGHVAGDACLQTVAQVMRDVFRRVDDLPARYGGEEFAVIIPGATEEQALFSAEMFRKAIEARGVPHEDSEAADVVTLSIGLAVSTVGPETSPDWFINRADEGLYISKANGRNRVSTAD
jgi:diguanylate cyclase (GGDEF)-like protein/PAS domain S-box-containing protein